MAEDPTRKVSGLAMTILVLLRLAIGWHLLYEGLYKLELAASDRPWSSSSYLENAEGPFASLFRGLAGSDEVPKTEKFEEDMVHEDWRRDQTRFVRFYGLDANGQESVQGEMDVAVKQWQQQVLEDNQWQRRIHQYRQDAGRNWDSLTSSERKRLASNDAALSGMVRSITLSYHSQLNGLLSAEQLGRGDWKSSEGAVGRVNCLVTCGLVLSGGCLLLGLFTRSAGVVAAALLLSFYLAMPPLPGLTATTLGGGHFLYVNNNLIEALAALLLAATHSGRVAGFDVVLGPIIDAARRSLFSSDNHPDKSKGSPDASEP